MKKIITIERRLDTNKNKNNTIGTYYRLKEVYQLYEERLMQ